MPLPTDPADRDKIAKRLRAQIDGTAKREYPEGRAGPGDEGALALAVAADHTYKLVRVVFGKPVTGLGLPPKDAVALAQILVKKARAVSTEPLVVDLG